MGDLHNLYRRCGNLKMRILGEQIGCRFVCLGFHNRIIVEIISCIGNALRCDLFSLAQWCTSLYETFSCISIHFVISLISFCDCACSPWGQCSDAIRPRSQSVCDTKRNTFSWPFFPPHSAASVPWLHGSTNQFKRLDAGLSGLRIWAQAGLN